MELTRDELHRQRGRLIDAFAAADELIGQAELLRVESGPLDVSIAERLAIRLLVKRFGWVVTQPGCIVRRKG
jgi:hypothetical protein